ncbi:protein angel homolog 2 isoform X1 [Clarias gariepinus]|uniref:protein angel homolog 2 isoform X1 n=1 Tax=Clarias gariepinus TaxID=13013 RepID=UPI00234C3DB4|nr:protein angel homolog 2 isoform X1 [Clarias gariepinus]XP_053370807.1 protein angel homolog 2 isoform X1 [Clarias gariepinus]XP_053370815.1 protein angel homolog 2 isoform X1 [Clarias gariepinus]
MFVRPLSAVASAPAGAAAAVWRHCCWYWRKTSPLIITRNPINSPRPPCSFTWSAVSSSDHPRHLRSSPGLMKNPDTEPPPVKRRKSSECEYASDGVQPGPKNSVSKERRERSPVPPGTLYPHLTRTKEIRTELKRQWEELTESCETTSVGAFDFSVMSYNILSQELLLSNTYLYRHCNPYVLQWHHRFSNLIAELEHHSADIMCLQEVQEDHYQRQIKPRLEHLGYQCEYKRRTGRKLDGCMIAFKKSHFTLSSLHPVEFFRQGIQILDRDNVGLIVVLKPALESGLDRSICVVTTHLLYNPRRGDIKLAQLALLLAEISRVALQDDGTTCPVLLCGDFNSVPTSPLYTFITDSKLEYAGIPIGKVSGQEESPRGQRVLTPPLWPPSLGISQLCQYECKTNADPDVQKSSNGLNMRHIEHGLKLTSVYSHFLKGNGHREITTCHSRTAITVDYIFYSAAQSHESSYTECRAAQDQGLELLSRLALVSESQLRQVNLLPNHRHSSDHLPLIARFRLHT